MKRNKVYTVAKATQVDVYHYHGSWFEYTWDLTLVDEEGMEVKGKYDTWTGFKNLEGKQIKLSNMEALIFDVVPPVESKV